MREHIASLGELGFTPAPDHYLSPPLKTRTNKPKAAHSFYALFLRRLGKVGVDVPKSRRASTDSMRVTVASHLLNERGAKLEDVQGRLGHSSPAMTRLFSVVSAETTCHS